MKKIILLAALAVAAFAVVGCQGEGPADTTPPKGADVATPGTASPGGGGNTEATPPANN